MPQHRDDSVPKRSDEPLLSICIPTYNRAAKLKRQLMAVLEQTRTLDDVEILVSDNCSGDDTGRVCAEFSGLGFRINRNETNIGSVRNINKLFELARGAYIWFLADDDILDQGTVKRVLSLLEQKRPALLYLNHRVVDGKTGATKIEHLLDPHGANFYPKGQQGVDEVSRQRLSQFMFISACIYRQSDLAKAIAMGRELAAPLRYSLYCASRPGGVAIVREVSLTNVWGDISWANESRKVHAEMVPKIILQMPCFGYRTSFMLSILIRYIGRDYKDFIQYWIPVSLRVKRLIDRLVGHRPAA
ncbi:glycosyltransferase family 2 protein [Solimonas flava]|uniref:glycosyltransferase family 2 protein n=1 Tax=Solimonas flava TaxID=415849 RepID=UPI000A012C19|nr:glycosyltransferase family 2 protein [Solimonas flava]